MRAPSTESIGGGMFGEHFCPNEINPMEKALLIAAKKTVWFAKKKKEEKRTLFLSLCFHRIPSLQCFLWWFRGSTPHTAFVIIIIFHHSTYPNLCKYFEFMWFQLNWEKQGNKRFAGDHRTWQWVARAVRAEVLMRRHYFILSTLPHH